MNRSFAALVVLLLTIAASAHELRPAYLELSERSSGRFDVLWKTPTRGDLRLSLTPEFSGRTRMLTPVATRNAGGAAVQSWQIEAVEPLRGQTVRIGGLEATMTDALVRIVFADGKSWTQRLTPQQPFAAIPTRPSRWSIAGVYLHLGVEHILWGIDHLLFVLALLIITRNGWKLVKTVSAFTLSHTITLTAATLGLVHVPQAPVEAIIALSIVFVASEIVQTWRGRVGLAARAPWLVALTFGLLHGLGFAGGLSEVGLPEDHIPLALLFFSIGVETGHLLFVGAVLALMTLARRVPMAMPSGARLAPPYAIGSIAMFWVIQRIAIF